MSRHRRPGTAGHVSRRFPARVIVLCALACGITACGASSSHPRSHTIVIALNVPVSADPYVAGVITRGARLAVDQENEAGGVEVGGHRYQLALRTFDDANDPATSAANVTSAIHDGAVAVIEDGIGMRTSAPKSAAAGVPEIAITDGDAGLLTDKNGNIEPSLFGLRIPNSAAGDVLATYIAESEHCSRVAILHDDSDNGRDGAASLTGSLQATDINPKPVLEVAADAPTLDTQALQLRDAKPCAIALWGGDMFIAKAISAIRGAHVLTPIYTSQAGESPAVRALDGNAVTDGVKFVSGRMTSETSTTDFPHFEQQLALHGLGPVDAGFKNAEGQEIRQPDDIDFFSYDAVHVIVAALQKDRSVQPSQQLLTSMTQVTVVSANGDARGFDSQAHEAFAFEDAYIAEIHDMEFEPVKNEALSASLPDENEILVDFKK